MHSVGTSFSQWTGLAKRAKSRHQSMMWVPVNACVFSWCGLLFATEVMTFVNQIAEIVPCLVTPAHCPLCRAHRCIFLIVSMNWCQGFCCPCCLSHSRHFAWQSRFMGLCASSMELQTKIVVRSRDYWHWSLDSLVVPPSFTMIWWRILTKPSC